MVKEQLLQKQLMYRVGWTVWFHHHSMPAQRSPASGQAGVRVVAQAIIPASEFVHGAKFQHFILKVQMHFDILAQQPEGCMYCKNFKALGLTLALMC